MDGVRLPGLFKSAEGSNKSQIEELTGMRLVRDGQSKNSGTQKHVSLSLEFSPLFCLTSRQRRHRGLQMPQPNAYRGTRFAPI